MYVFGILGVIAVVTVTLPYLLLSLSFVLGVIAVVTVTLAIKDFVMSVKENEDRKKNPEKWAKIDAERAKIEAESGATRYWNIYREATKRIPRSKWILMKREEKSNIFEQRESLKSQYENLPNEVKKIVRKRYSLDTSFKNLN